MVHARLKDGRQQTTVIRMAANYVARAMSYPWTNTLATIAATAHIAATARKRHRYMCICRGLGCEL